MNSLFPENSYMGKCFCGKEFIGPKGVIHCHLCLYQKISELENNRTQSQWISVWDDEPEQNKWYWHVYAKYDGTFTDVHRGQYIKATKKMKAQSEDFAFTHFAESLAPLPPKEQVQ